MNEGRKRQGNVGHVRHHLAELGSGHVDQLLLRLSIRLDVPNHDLDVVQHFVFVMGVDAQFDFIKDRIRTNALGFQFIQSSTQNNNQRSVGRVGSGLLSGRNARFLGLDAAIEMMQSYARLSSVRPQLILGVREEVSHA